MLQIRAARERLCGAVRECRGSGAESFNAAHRIIAVGLSIARPALDGLGDEFSLAAMSLSLLSIALHWLLHLPSSTWRRSVPNSFGYRSSPFPRLPCKRCIG